MRRQKRRLLFPVFLTQQFNSKDNQAKQEDENADAVDTVHVTNPLIFRTVRVFLSQVEVFRYLFPDSHKYNTNLTCNWLKIKVPFQGLFVEVTGVEPVTFCMPCKRSSQLS
jgi:hypothetical protein